MQIAPFQLERYFARYEFNARYLLSSSDCESLGMGELLELASPATRGLWNDLRLGYTESAGHPQLRAGIAGLYAHIRAEDVLCAAPEEAILIAMNQLQRPGDRVVAVWPAYQSLYAVAQAIGCVVTPWPLRLEGGRWRADLAQLAEILPGARLLVLNFPHNPTGYLPRQAEFETILELAEQAGAAVFSDEMYRLLERDPGQRLPAACDLSPRAVSLSGLSKSFGLPGLRAGWLACQNQAWMADFQAFKDYTTICASAPGEILAIAALEAKDDLLARCQGIVAANLEQAVRFFGSRAHLFDWIATDAGPVAFPLWRGRLALEEFCAAAVERHGVMIVPAAEFGAEGAHFRVGLGRLNFPAALQALDAALRSVQAE